MLIDARLGRRLAGEAPTRTTAIIWRRCVARCAIAAAMMSAVAAVAASIASSAIASTSISAATMEEGHIGSLLHYLYETPAKSGFVELKRSGYGGLVGEFDIGKAEIRKENLPFRMA